MMAPKVVFKKLWLEKKLDVEMVTDPEKAMYYAEITMRGIMTRKLIQMGFTTSNASKVGDVFSLVIKNTENQILKEIRKTAEEW